MLQKFFRLSRIRDRNGALSLDGAIDGLVDIEKPKSSAARTKGDKARDDHRWGEAITHYSQHLESFPKDFAIYVQLGHMFKQTSSYEHASNAYNKALEISPHNADLLLQMGHLSKLRGDLKSAFSYYQRSAEIDHNSDAMMELTLPDFAAIAEQDGYAIDFDWKTAGTILSPYLRTASAGSVDTISGWVVRGWAYDSEAPKGGAALSIFVGGRLVATTIANRFRGDIAAQALAPPFSGFECSLDLDFSNTESYEVSVRLTRTGQELSGSPAKLTPPDAFKRWLQRKDRTRGDELALVRQYAQQQGAGKLSIIMPVYNCREKWLREAIESVCDQWCANWELICVDDCSTDAGVRRILEEYAARDARIRPIFLEQNVGIATSTNRGITAVTGNLIGFMDHDDYLEPDAVHRMLFAAASGADLIYSDEAVTGEDINVIQHVAARPAFSHDYYLSHPYFVHFVCVRAEIAKAIGGLDETLPISADVDFVLRAIEQSTAVGHVPAVLYRWRTHETSTGHQKKDMVTANTISALDRHLQRFGYDGSVVEGDHYNVYRANFRDPGGKTAIIIPTKNRHDLLRVCLESIWRTVGKDDCDIVVIDHDSRDPDSRAYLNSIAGRVRIVPFFGPFNYAKMNNYAVSLLNDAYDYLVFMNNDIEAIGGGWLERLRSLCGRGDVGVAGATLLYAMRTIQHSGVVLGLGDLVDHAHKFQPYEVAGQRNLGYNISLASTRDYSAVTGACMMIPAALFTGVGGFDESLEIGYNDTDLCLRVGTLGYKIINDAHAVLYHHESATRSQTDQIFHPEDAKRLVRRWSKLLLAGDPFYNPLLVHRPAVDHTIGSLDDWYAPVRVRNVRPDLHDPAEATPERIGFH